MNRLPAAPPVFSVCIAGCAAHFCGRILMAILCVITYVGLGAWTSRGTSMTTVNLSAC